MHHYPPPFKPPWRVVIYTHANLKQAITKRVAFPSKPHLLLDANYDCDAAPLHADSEYDPYRDKNCEKTGMHKET